MDKIDYSKEQLLIISSIYDKNVIVDSIAGSGKTTTSIEIGRYYKNENILIITYNKRQKEILREQIHKEDLKNIEIHNYHSYCVKYYDIMCYNDINIKDKIKICEKNEEKKYGIIIIDEAQEINDIYYELIYKICKENQGCRLCIMGDRKQTINEYNKSDERYMIYGEEMFRINNKGWIRCKLTQSFRVTKEMSLFINNVMYKNEVIKSERETLNKPRYIICDTFGIQPFNEIKYYLDKGYKAGDIFIIAPSIKNINSPVRRLEIKIRRLILNVEVYITDDEELNEGEMEGKIVITTIHQVKGLERKVVILYNFDDSYYTYYKRNVNREICVNELYVGVTRGIEELTLLHHNQNEYFKFINEEELNKYCLIKNKINDKSKLEKNNKITIYEIIKDLPDVIIQECMKYLDISKEGSKRKILKIEEGEISSLIVTSEFENKNNGKVSIFKKNVKEEIICLFEGIEYNDGDKIIKRANEWYKEKTGHKEGYKRLSKEIINRCIKRLERLKLGERTEYEKEIYIEGRKELINKQIKGYINCIDNKNIYEIRCNKEIRCQEYVKMGLIMYIIEMNKLNNINKIEKDKIKLLINIKKDNILRIEKIIHQIEKDDEEDEKMKLKENELLIYEKELKEKYNNNDIIEGDIIIFEYEGLKIEGKIKIISNLFIKNNAYIYLYDNENKYMYNKIKGIEYRRINNEIQRIKDYYKSNKSNKEYKDIYEKYIEIKCQLKNRNKIIYIKEEIYKEYNDNLKDKEELEIIHDKINIEEDERMEYKIYNIMTDEKIIIKSDIYRLIKMIDYILYNKYINLVKISDNEFINKRIPI